MAISNNDVRKDEFILLLSENRGNDVVSYRVLCRALSILFAFLFLILSFSRAEAMDLIEFEQKLAEYQREPGVRAEALIKQSDRLRRTDTGLARQYEVPLTRILQYGVVLDDTVNLYKSIYFLQRTKNANNYKVFSEAKARKLMSSEPPYSFLSYLNLVREIDACRSELQKQKNMLAYGKSRISNTMEERGKYERAFRLLVSKINDEGKVKSPRTEGELLEIKALLELNFANETLYKVSCELADSCIDKLNDELAEWDPLLIKVRANVRFGDKDYAQLDAKAFAGIEAMNETIKRLESRYGELEKKSKGNVASLSENWITIERGLIEDEILELLDMTVYQSTIRLLYRGMEDLLSGNLDLGEQKKLLSKTQQLVDDIDFTISDSNGLAQFLRQKKELAENQGDYSSFEDREYVATRRDFLENLNAYNLRRISHMTYAGSMREQALMLLGEMECIIKSNNKSADVVTKVWYDYFDDIMDFELWHFGDMPLTVKSLLKAVAAFITGLALTYFLLHIFRRRIKKKNLLTGHGFLIAQNIIYAFGFVLSLILSLWFLNIPMAAFAFVGGFVAVALGLGGQKIVGDFLSGMMILFQGKIRIGDDVIIEDRRGIVKDITIQHTIIRCQKSKDFIISNSKLQSTSFVNLTLGDTILRVDVPIQISRNNDISKISDIIQDVLDKDEYVLKKPESKILFENFERFSIKVTVRFFTDLKINDDEYTASDVRSEILRRFKEENVVMVNPAVTAQDAESEHCKA